MNALRGRFKIIIFNVFIFSFPAPPSSVEILDHPSHSKIEIKENQEFHLECRVKNAKPAAKIVWYRGNVELNIREYTSKNKLYRPEAKRFHVV